MNHERNVDVSESPSGADTVPSEPARRRRLAMNPHASGRGMAAQQALDESSPDAAADERILHELVAKQLPIALTLHDIEEQLAMRILNLMDDPRLAIAVARVLHETSILASAATKRIQSTLSTAASLRAQRRFLKLQVTK